MTLQNAANAIGALSIAISQAETYHILLGPEWNHNAGTTTVRRGYVRIDARNGEIRFRDLVPDGQPRQDYFITLPPGVSNGVAVAVIRAIYEATKE